tara:strand:- start:146 stop:511 length:366 start_codon:yes stop_codon:yes gene_type:complete
MIFSRIKNKVKQVIETQTTLLQKKAGTFKIEDVKDDLGDDYTGVPAPVIAPADPWFTDPPLTEKQMDYMERETETKKQESGKEDPDIHQKMYEIATENWSTVQVIDDGWMSGTGYQGQFKG